MCSSDLVVINNLGVSRQHARIIQDGDDFIIEDMGSRNGTVLNNQEVKQSKLKDNDEIMIGKHLVVFVENDEPVKIATVSPSHFPDALPPDETLKMGTLNTKRMTKEDSEKPAVDNREVGVEILEGGIDQDVVHFQRLLIVAGQGPKVDIRIKGNYDKDVVFVVSNRPSGFFISPPKGISLKVNGEEVMDYVPLKDGDMIEAEETKMKFFMRAH